MNILHRVGKRLATLIAVLAISALTGELVLRAAGALWPPASVFVAHHRIADEQLGWRLNPDYPDVDSWSFRNAEVPEQADVVILGDSQTYGYGVAPEQAWPQQFSALSGQSTYNIACSGYSSVHGMAIWADAMSLRPQVVVAAVYAGNDLYDTFQLVYGRGQLAHLRTPYAAVQTEISALETLAPLAEQARLVTRMGRSSWPLRDVLRDHSALFQFIRHLQSGSTALAGRQADSWERTRQRARLYPDYLYAYDGGEGARTTLTLHKRLLPQDTADARIEEGLQMTLRALAEMSRRSIASGARFVILWIPTKELVFAPRVATEGLADFTRLIAAETHFQQQVQILAEQSGISFVDALPELRQSLQAGDSPYPESADGHPTAAGHARIAQAVLRKIRSKL